MANTFELISSVTVGSGGASSIDFTSIPSTYTDLVLKTNLRVSSGGGYTISRQRLKINSITTGYSNKLLYALNNSPASGDSTDYITFFYATASDATATTFSSADIYAPNYAGSSYKSFSVDAVTETNAANGAILALNAGLLSNTAAISSLSITDSNGFSYAQYSTAYLYGVKNA